MTLKYLKKLNLLLLSLDEIKRLIREEIRRILFDELNEQKVDLWSFYGNKQIVEEFISDLVKKNNKRKEFVELFYATELAETIYKSDDILVGFELKKNIQPNSITNVATFQNLVDILEENTPCGFCNF